MTRADVNLMFRAFSEPLRLRILSLLWEREMCVGDLVSVLHVPQPTASRHLRYLKRAGLVRDRSEGRWAFYSLSPSADSFHKKLLVCLEGCFDKVPEIQDDKKRCQRVRKKGGCCPR